MCSMRVRETIWGLCVASLSVLACLPAVTGKAGTADSGAARGTLVGVTAATEQPAFLELPQRRLKGCARGPSLLPSLTSVTGLQVATPPGPSGRIPQAADAPRGAAADTSLLSLHCLLVV